MATLNSTKINGKLSISCSNESPIEITCTAAYANYNESIRMHPYNSSYNTSIIFCGANNTGSSGTSDTTWIFYNHEGGFHIRHNTSDAIYIYRDAAIYVYRNIQLSKDVTFANNTWNLVGDDCYIGDHNIAGAFCLKGANGTTNISFYAQGSDTNYKQITYDGTTLYLNGTASYANSAGTASSANYATSAASATNATSAEFPSLYGGNIAHSYWTGAFPNGSSGFTQMFGYSLNHGNVNSAQDTGDIVFALKPVGSTTAELNIGIDGNYYQRSGQPVVSVASYSSGVLSLQAGY